MDDKLHHHHHRTRGPRDSSLPNQLWRWLSIACVAFTCFSLVGTRLGSIANFLVSRYPSRGCASHSANVDNHAVYTRYEGESITWEPCGEFLGHALECSELVVPMDHFDDVSSGDDTFTIALTRMRGHNATHGKNLIINPGGPGASGLEFLYRKGEILNAIVGEGFHLLAFDPRGVNMSHPQALCYPDSKTRERLAPVRNKDPVADSAELFAWTENLAQACVDTTGKHGPHINTPQTAADMDSILDAVGQEKMYYWGFSYGSILGQTYAMMYPERSERVIIDAVANVFDWYDKFDTEMWEDTERVMDGFFDECVFAGERCALAAFGATREEIQNQFFAVADALKEQPMSIYINESLHGLLEYETLLYEAMFPALYKPALWHELAEKVTSFMLGNGTDLFMTFKLGPTWNIQGEALYFVLINDAKSGTEFWPKKRAELLDELMPFLNSSLFAITENPDYYLKSKWLLPDRHGFRPSHGVETSHPLLILSTTYDPVCPLKSAQVAQDAFKDSRLVEVLGYGHGSIAMPSKCLASHVRSFLVDGELPPHGAQCEVDVPYFLSPEEQRSAVMRLAGDDEEAERLYFAQLRLAQEADWPRPGLAR